MDSILHNVQQLGVDLVKAVDIQAPSLDRPFGIHLWPLFDTVWTRFAGYPAREFAFKYGETPIGTMREAGGLIIAYYLIIFGGREIMRPFKPFKLQTLFQIHNLMLTWISGALLLLFLEHLIPEVWRNGLLHGICSIEGGWQPLVALYYVCYIPEIYLAFVAYANCPSSSTTSPSSSSFWIPCSLSSRRSL